MERAVDNGRVETASRERRILTADVTQQIVKILQSEGFRNSESLRGLLDYLGRLYAANPDGSVSEHDLAVSVFGRRSDFDSRTDSVVRVHTGRLRARLAEYYMSDGAADEMVVEIPKGRYCLTARQRPPANAGTEEPADTPAGVNAHPRRIATPAWRRRAWMAAAMLSVVVLVAVAVWWLLVEPLPPALSTLWGEFTHQPTPTLVVFSNPPLVGSAYKEMHLYRPGIDSAADINDFYSGSGEVVAAHLLTRTFLALRSSILVKRAQALSWDDVNGRGLIIIGSPSQNLPAGEVALNGFHFTHGETFNEIVNEKPAQGEPAVFRTDGPPYATDYAILAYRESPTRLCPAIVVAGTTTYGTQAAAEFVTNESKVAGLLKLLHVPLHQNVPHFTVILEQKIIHGAIVRNRPVLVRIHEGT